MSSDLQQTATDLKTYLERLEQQADESEMICLRLQGHLAALERLGCLSTALFVGPNLLTTPYAATEGGNNSCLIAQAALKVPGGIGVVWIDSDHHESEQGLVDDSRQECEYRFESYQKCPAALRALLLPHLPQLLEELARWVPFTRQQQAAHGLPTSGL
jgi:hypothetical protein